MFGPLFNSKPIDIKRINKDGYGDAEVFYRYTKVPCQFRRGVALSYKGEVVDIKVIANVIIPPEYSEVEVDDIIVYGTISYVISTITELTDIFSNIMGWKIQVKSYG